MNQIFLRCVQAFYSSLLNAFTYTNLQTQLTLYKKETNVKIDICSRVQEKVVGKRAKREYPKLNEKEQ